MSEPVLTHVEIDCPSGTSETGAFAVSWKGPEGSSYRLYEDGDLLYEGPETATTITGREAGAYQYTVAIDGNHSASCGVEVAPPSLGLAFALFGVGFVVFAATLALVVAGHRAHPGKHGGKGGAS